jgi:outer membrane protein assembly factor BamB
MSQAQNHALARLRTAQQGEQRKKDMANTRDPLKLALKDGLSIFSRIWDYKAKNWVMCITVADIDGDGDVEIIIGSRDGRIYCFSKTGKLRWQREIGWQLETGMRAWVDTIAISGMARPGEEAAVRIIVGTRDGKVYVLDSEGCLLTKDGAKLLFNEEGQPLDRQLAQDAYWFNINHVIRSICVDPLRQSRIILGSEDRCVYGLDLRTGEQLWQYATGGHVRSVFACDLNSDGQDEVLFGSVDGNLYVLDLQGQELTRYALGHPIRTVFVEDIDKDGKAEILLSTDHKNLIALTCCKGQFTRKWEYEHFENRLLTLYATDIDGDGQKEIIASCEDKCIYILSSQGKFIWRHNHRYRTFDIAIADIDNDGAPELLIGDENQRIRAMHVRLRRGVAERIRRYYHRLEEPQLRRLELDKDEQNLLADVVGLNARKLVTFEQAEERLAQGEYLRALSILLRLAQQKVEQAWHRDDMEYIRTVCFRSTTKQSGREIVIGTADGHLAAFYASGRLAWTKPLEDHIVDVQSGFFEHHSPKEDILICSTDHHLYILVGEKGPLHRKEIADAQVSSICVRATGNREAPEIIIGSEARKLFIYDHDLHMPKAEFSTEEGVSIVRGHVAADENTPEIVVAGRNNSIYAYRRSGKRLWQFETFDHIKAVCIKDINNDGQPEILVGSEDRNIHVLDSVGHQLWRYYLPHSALTIDAADVDQDGMVEIFVGCADGTLYVFNRSGDLLWTYQAKDRIHAVRLGDIDGDNHYEIALTAEDEFELLRVVNQQQVADTIARCWTQLCRQSSPEEVINQLLKNDDVFLQAFALKKLVEQGHLQARDFDAFEDLAKNGGLEVRKQLAALLPNLSAASTARARTLLRRLSTDLEYEVRNVTIDCLPALMRYDWDEGFYYLKRAIENSSRYVRRIAVRKIDELIDPQTELLLDRNRRHQIFDLLLVAAQDKISTWVRQEAAQVLAHYLDQHPGSLIVYVHLFIAKNLQRHIWEQIAHVATGAIIRRYITAVTAMLYDLNESNVGEKLWKMVQAQQDAEKLRYGLDLRLIYEELHRLFMLKTLEDISHYRCELEEENFDRNNQYVRAVLPVFKALRAITRPLTMYFQREDLRDRLNSLLEAMEAINRSQKTLDQQYAISLLGEPISKLPDYQVFLLLFRKWQALLQKQLSELRGKAELKVTLLTRDVPREAQVGILVEISNGGRSSASNVKLTLLQNDSFEVVGKNTFETEIIAAGEGTSAEFILAPRAAKLPLVFEVVFDDVSGEMVVQHFPDCIELHDSQQAFRTIPNPYSTGTPAHDSDLFYGREEEKTFLVDNLTRPARGVIVLYGQRRSGKTSLLSQLIQSPELAEHIPVFLDMQRLSYHVTIENFLRRVVYLMKRAMKQKDIAIKAPEPQEFERDPIHAFDVFLDQIEEQLGERKLILLIDEFEVLEEQVTRGQLEPEIFEYLRDIVQHRTNTRFLFSGTHQITEFTKWYRSVFFHIAIHYRLSRLAPSDAEDLIQKPVVGYLEYELLTVQKIRQLTADQPYLIHLICRAIVDYCNKQRKNYVTINDVNIVLHQVMQTGQFHFDWLWDQIKPEERVVLAAIAECSKEEGRWISLDEIEEIYYRRRFPYKSDYVIETLKMLREFDIIEAEQENLRKSRFRIAVGLIRTWMLREHPLETVGKELHA